MEKINFDDENEIDLNDINTLYETIEKEKITQNDENVLAQTTKTDKVLFKNKEFSEIFSKFVNIFFK